MADTLVSNCILVVTGALKTPRDYIDLSQLTASRTIHPILKGKGGTSDGEAGRHLFATKTFAERASTKFARAVAETLLVQTREGRVLMIGR